MPDSRHAWTKHDSTGRSKTCDRCSMRVDRFGVGRSSYYVWSLPGGPDGNTQDGSTVPGCLGTPDPDTRIPRIPQVQQLDEPG